MANTRSAKKQIRVQERKRLRNQRVRSAAKTAFKHALFGVDTAPAEAREAVRKAIIALDKAVSKSIIHKNKAARKKARLMKRLNLSLKDRPSA